MYRWLCGHGLIGSSPEVILTVRLIRYRDTSLGSSDILAATDRYDLSASVVSLDEAVTLVTIVVESVVGLYSMSS